MFGEGDCSFGLDVIIRRQHVVNEYIFYFKNMLGERELRCNK